MYAQLLTRLSTGVVQGVHAPFELGHQVLLVAPATRRQHDLIGRHLAVIGDEEEVAVLLSEPHASLLSGQSLAEHDHAIIPVASHRPVIELGNHLLERVNGLEATLLDDSRLVPLRSLPRDCFDLRYRPLQEAVRRVRQLLGQGHQIGSGIDAEEEAEIAGLIPTIEMLGLGEVGVPRTKNERKPA